MTADNEQHGAEGTEFMFKRDYKSSIRSNYNHYTMRGTAKYLLHPSIPLDRPDLRIADIGTRTGIWALELANTLPDTIKIDCYDESDSQFPHKAFYPSNVRFEALDGFKPFPSDLQGQFDVVHVRFWLTRVNDSAFEPLFKNILALLKPGGYLQWFEPLAWDSKAVSFNPGAPQAASEKIAQSWYKPKPDTSYNWVYNMQKAFEEEGLKDVVREVHTIPAWLRPLWMQGCLAGIEDMISLVNVWDESTEAIKKMMNDLEHEIAQGVTVDTPFQCVVGRRI